jgi:hypothetical protein
MLWDFFKGIKYLTLSVVFVFPFTALQIEIKDAEFTVTAIRRLEWPALNANQACAAERGDDLSFHCVFMPGE